MPHVEYTKHNKQRWLMWAPVNSYARCVYAIRVNECAITVRVKVFNDCLHAKRGGSLHVHSQLNRMLGMRHRA